MDPVLDRYYLFLSLPALSTKAYICAKHVQNLIAFIYKIYDVLSNPKHVCGRKLYRRVLLPCCFFKPGIQIGSFSWKYNSLSVSVND